MSTEVLPRVEYKYDSKTPRNYRFIDFVAFPLFAWIRCRIRANEGSSHERVPAGILQHAEHKHDNSFERILILSIFFFQFFRFCSFEFTDFFHFSPHTGGQISVRDIQHAKRELAILLRDVIDLLTSTLLLFSCLQVIEKGFAVLKHAVIKMMNILNEFSS